MKNNLLLLAIGLIVAVLTFVSQYPLSIQVEAVTPLVSVKVHMLEQVMASH